MPIIFRLLALLIVCGAGAYVLTTITRVLVGRGRGQALDATALEERLARLEASVDTLSAETHRLAEGHRFFTQLMAERPSTAGRLPAASNGSRDGRSS